MRMSLARLNLPNAKDPSMLVIYPDLCARLWPEEFLVGSRDAGRLLVRFDSFGEGWVEIATTGANGFNNFRKLLMDEWDGVRVDKRVLRVYVCLLADGERAPI